MFEKIIAFSVKNKLFVLLFVALLIAAGIYSIKEIPLDAVPDITNNQVQVVTVSPSSAPQEVEKFITYPLELALANLPDVTEIRSISRFGLSVITVVFSEDIPTLQARQLVSEQINIASTEIPEGLGQPELMPITTGLGEIFQYTLQVEPGFENKYSPTELRTIQDWIVKRRLSGITGIIEVSSFGGYLKQYEVAVDPYLLRSFNLSIIDVFNALHVNNQNSGGSYIEKDGMAYYIRTEGLAASLSDIEQIVVGNTGTRAILVKDVANVGFGSAKRFGAMTKDGKGETVGGITLMYKGANSYEAIVNVKERVEEIQKMLPEGVHIEPYLDRSSLIDKAIKTVSKNLLEGGLIVVFVLVLLLGNLRAGLIVASTIPLSMLFALTLMNLFGVSANLMSLGAIDFGIVVDGAVIITEGVLHILFAKHLGQVISQKDFDDVIVKASSSIYKSAAFGVLIILVVFVPILTLQGTEGKMFRPMAQTVSFAILGAFILSATYIPVVSSLFLNKHIKERVTIADRIMKFLRSLYEPTLKIALNKPYLVIGATLLALVFSVFTYNKMGAEFTPTLEEGDFAMQMALPPGSSLKQSIAISTEAEKILKANFPEVLHVVSKIGTAEVPTDPMAIEDADIMVILAEKENWTTTKDRFELIALMEEKLAVITGASFEFTQPIQLRFNELMTGSKSDIAIKIFGEDLNELAVLAKEVAKIVEPIQGAADVKVDKTEGLPQLVIHYNRSAMAYYGVSINDLNTIVRSAFAGEIAGFVFEGERKFDLAVRLKKPEAENPDLAKLFIAGQNGQMVPISELATLERNTGPMQITRENTKRRINIGVNVRDRDIATLVEEIKRTLDAKMTLPPGYYFQFGGEFEKLEAASARLKVVVPIALFLIFLLLFFTFKSTKYALLIFSAVPLSAIGGIYALWLRDMPFSISAGVGFIALFGVAVLNGIVLISHFNELKLKGYDSIKSLVIEGGSTRLRPVLMTALVASLGFLPMALSTSAGAEVQKPLATVVIGGLISATLLTLVLLPVLYTLIEKKKMPKPSGAIAAVFIMFFMFNQTKASAQNTDTWNLQQIEAYTLSNHPILKNAELNTQSAVLYKMESWELNPLDLSYQNGQINYDGLDHFTTISQDFGNLLQRIKSAAAAKQKIELSKAEYTLLQNSILQQTRTAYSNWYYSTKSLELLEKYSTEIAEIERIANIKKEVGEISELEFGLITMQNAKLLIQINQQQITAQQSLSYLRQIALIPNNIVPDTSEYTQKIPLEKDSISFAFVRQAQAQINWANEQINVQKAGYFPQFSLGYFNQSLENTAGFSGYQVGLKLPIWWWSNSYKLDLAKIEAEKTQNMVGYEINAKQQQLNNLFLALEKSLANSQKLKSQLKLVTELSKINQKSVEKGEIDYLRYFQQKQMIIDAQLSFITLQNEQSNLIIEINYLNN